MMNIIEMAKVDDRFRVDTISKNGIKRIGISLRDIVSPIVYLENIPHEVKTLDDLFDLLKVKSRIANMREIAITLLDWDAVKDKLFICVQKKTDDNILKMGMLDLEKYVRIFINEDYNAKVTEELAEQWGKTKQDIFKAARANTRKRTVIKSMVEMMLNLAGISIDEANGIDPMTVVMTDGISYGAGAMAVKSVREAIAEKAGGNFYALPSSIHEWIIVPENCGMDAEGLKAIVESVNATEVSPDERLSDSVYLYHADTKKLTIAA